jgi:hypothetical protein
MAKYGVKKTSGIRTIPRMTRKDLAILFNELGFTKGVEIGVAGGDYSEILLDANPRLKLVGVDPYEHYGDYTYQVSQAKMDKLYKKVLLKFAGRNYSLYRFFSMDAVPLFEPNSLDFVYIDGNHTLRYVVDDLVEWSMLVRKGGIIAGHDYRYERNRRGNAQVIWALKAFCYVYDVQPLFIAGRSGTLPIDHFRSWFLVKTWDK